MSFTVSLHKEPKMSFNIKYRDNFTAPALYTTTAVNVGNFDSLNLFVDNSVELACGQLQPPIGTYERATECNYIKIVWGAYTVIGLITDWVYINDGNVKLSYNVDSFMSARESGLIESAKGICERVNMEMAGLLTNLQSEPFSPSDVTELNREVTESLNAFCAMFEDITPSGNGLSDPNTSYILTVSPAVIEYLGVGQFVDPGFSFAQELKEKPSLDFYQSDTTLHAGGCFRGTPLKFQYMFQLSMFIRQILGGCGFRTKLPASGYSTQEADTYRQYITNANTGAGQVTNSEKNTESDPIESIRFITVNDIYNLYCIPSTFAVQTTNVQGGLTFINGFKTLGNLHKWGGEDSGKTKLLAHPYYYVRAVTANGDSTNIIPQTHYLDIDSPYIDTRVGFYIRFIGGDTPRIMGRFVLRGNEGDNSYSLGTAAEWFTIRNYPSVTLSINDSHNPQIMRDVANTRKISALYTNSRMSAQLSNPVKQGYLDTVNGVSTQNTAQSGWDKLAGGLGGIMGSIDKFGASIGFGNAAQGQGMFEDKSKLAAWNERRTIQAGNFITAETLSIMGNDFVSQFTVPAFAAFDCGATDTEMFTFSRHIEEFGVACNDYVEPLPSGGTVLGGEGTIKAIDGRTFYQFSNITINGNMPIQWKNNIKSLFESGVYLLDN